MKKLLSVLFALVLVVACAWALSTEASAATEGYYTYVVSGGNAIITDCDESISGAVTIPSKLGGYPVTVIDDDAFRSCYMTSVTIPNSVTSIGDSAFSWCTSLKSVAIPNSVKTIGWSAFYNCSGLTSVTIPNSVTTIGKYAFYYCTSLTSVTIGNGVTTIGDWAFHYCTSLTSVTIGNGVTTIGSDAFSECTSLTSVTIPNSVTSIGNWAFACCTSLTSVTIPNSVKTIGDRAFASCTSLTSVTIPNSVTSIGRGAFSYCNSLTSVTIGNGVTTIGSYAFYDCSSLTWVNMGNNVETINSNAFVGCYGLTSIFIPKSVKNIYEDAFNTCYALTDVYYAGTEEEWNAIGINSGNTYLDYATVHYNTSGFFPDVKAGAWYYNAVQFAVKNGYFSGNGDGTFGANNNITRQDFVVVLSRIAGANLSKYSGKTSFADVPSSAYYAKAIHWATENGVISGYNATKFGVGDSLTREQLVTILSRYAQKKGVNVTPTSAALSKLNAYSDASKVNPAMKNAVAWALQNKVISGMTSTTVGPQGKATRAQVAAILFNINSYKIIPGI